MSRISKYLNLDDRVKQTFYSHGKLLLTGEYVVLDGAVGLTVPTKKGQSLVVTPGKTKGIHWKSYTVDNTLWFEAQFSIENGIITTQTQNKTATTLKDILNTALQLNPTFLNATASYEMTTHLEFEREWGLGTSSTLINNIAQWAHVDAFVLLENSFGGSGYDIAAAQNSHPIFYKKTTPPTIRKAGLSWDFINNLYFIHLNQKQDSKEGIAHYRNATVTANDLQTITDLSHKLLLCYTLQDFGAIMEAHERIISRIIKTPTVKERLFPDYSGSIKSLGAWGGDFVLVTATSPEKLDYFREKGYETVIRYEDMVY